MKKYIAPQMQVIPVVLENALLNSSSGAPSLGDRYDATGAEEQFSDEMDYSDDSYWGENSFE